ncbi:MAG: sigma-54-dependent Fis family transcriptional regulator [Burkholderiaceae bacterium]
MSRVLGQASSPRDIPSGARAEAHARVLLARGAALPPDGRPAPEILDSWVRCREAGLDPRAALTGQIVMAADLARRRERAAFLRRLAQAELETLSQQIAGSNFLLAFADQDGVILDLYADNRFSMSEAGAGAGIAAGSRWHESLCGTNGLGTALVTGQAIAVTGMEHYLLGLGGISCAAAPIRDAGGEIVGALDASSYFGARQRHTLALVQMAATHLENALLSRQMRGHWLLALHPRAEFLGTLSEGLLAFDGEGRLLAINARGQQLLAGLDARRGSRFEALFGERFEGLLARLHDKEPMHLPVHLRDLLGSALRVQCRGRPAPSVAARPAAPGAPGVSAGEAIESTDCADPAVRAARQLVSRAVGLRAPILICGESGTGKELLARHAHAASGRGGAFVAVNCAALPAELFEAELFGHVGGAFTGARREGNAGLIASADGGTLLLDEIGELPLPLQAALLRFLDEQWLRPVGGTRSRKVDVQLLAATNADLEQAVAERRFRADLLYRLDTVRVSLPPLRQRHDFATLARAQLRSIDAGASLSEAALARLQAHAWPGNFRELRALLTRALLIAGPRRLERADVERVLPAARAGADGPATAGSALQQGAADLVVREFERNGGSISQTARGLGISRTTVYRHLRQQQSRRPPGEPEPVPR